MQKVIVIVELSTHITVDVPDEFVPDNEDQEESCQSLLMECLSKNEGLLRELVFDKETSVKVTHYGWNSTSADGDLEIKKEFVVNRSK